MDKEVIKINSIWGKQSRHYEIDDLNVRVFTSNQGNFSIPIKDVERIIFILQTKKEFNEKQDLLNKLINR